MASEVINQITNYISQGTDVANAYLRWGETYAKINEIRTGVVNQVLTTPPEGRAAIIDVLVINEALILKTVHDRLSTYSEADAAIFKRTIQRDNQYLLEDLAKIYHSSTDASNRRLAYSVYTTFSDGKAPPKIKEPEPEPVLPTLAEDAPMSSLPAAAPSSADGTPYLYVDPNAPQLPPPSIELLSPPPAPQVIAPQPASAPAIMQFADIDTAGTEALEDFLRSKGYFTELLNDASAVAANDPTMNALTYPERLRVQARALFNDPSASQPTSKRDKPGAPGDVLAGTPTQPTKLRGGVLRKQAANPSSAPSQFKSEISVAEGEVVF